MQEYDNINTPPQGVLLPGNTQLCAALAHALVDALPNEVQAPILGGGYYINRDHVPALADQLLGIVAYTVSSLIDAGSERDAVMENDQLRKALENELYGWGIDVVS